MNDYRFEDIARIVITIVAIGYLTYLGIDQYQKGSSCTACIIFGCLFTGDLVRVIIKLRKNKT